MKLETKQLTKIPNDDILDLFGQECFGADRCVGEKEHTESDHNLTVLRAEILERMGGC